MSLGKKLLVISLLLVVSGCMSNYNMLAKHYKGNGDITTTSYDLQDDVYDLVVQSIFFSSELLTTSHDIIIDESYDNEVSIKTDMNILDTISIDVNESMKKITITGDKNLKYDTSNFILTIGVPIKSISIDGGFALTANLPTVKTFSYEITGAVDSDIHFVELDSLVINVDGAGDLTFSGSVANCTIEINGASDINAYDLKAEFANIVVNGASDVQINVSNKLIAEINGVGSITYDGDPAEVDQDVNGVGTIKKRK